MDKFIIKYYRLSKADLYGDESNSITNQRKITEQFLYRKEEFKFTQSVELMDDGYSGTNFDRPGMQKLLELVNDRKVICIIVKDLSRFGRNSIEMDNYLERVLPFLDVRFIAINDNFDSNDYVGDLPGLEIAYKNLFNEYVSVSMSYNTKCSIYKKRETGEHVGAFAPYGYCKRKETGNRLFIDPKAAEIVRRIFKMTLDGVSRSEMVRIFNKENILTPGDYKRKLKCERMGKPFVKRTEWYADAIRYILSNEEYIGTAVSGKFFRPVMGRSKVKAIDKEKWHRVYNAHEAIISKEDFARVQETFGEKWSCESPKAETTLTGILSCGHCQKALSKRYLHGNPYYHCITHRKTERFSCTGELIAESQLVGVVFSVIKGYLTTAVNRGKVMGESEEKTTQRSLGKKRPCESFENRRKSIFYEKTRLYEQYKLGQCDKTTYFQRKEQLSKQLEELQVQYSTEKGEEDVLAVAYDKNWMKEVMRFEKEEYLTRELLVSLIERIYVYDLERIEIKFKYADLWIKY